MPELERLRSQVRLRPSNPYFGATLSPFWYGFACNLGERGACRAVAREERAGESG